MPSLVSARPRRAARAQVVRPAESRAFVDDILAELRASRWSARGWGRFLGRSLVRSAEQVWRHPRAAAELTVAHGALLAASRRPWAAASWVLAITHLGLLAEGEDSLGWATRVTLVRANLPALVRRAAPWTAVVALATDRIDGRLAREAGETAFGAYADALADAAFWTWFARRHERDRRLRLLATTVWLTPAAAITLAYVLGGRSVDYPRPAAVRAVSVGMQGLITLRAGLSPPGAAPPRARRCVPGRGACPAGRG
jgi:phosphatidylglycerophosphate synthase